MVNNKRSKNVSFESFQTPPVAYRSMPFWSWNDVLSPDEVRWQARAFKEAGWGGFFMHSRIGLRTQYLSDDWMKAIAAGIDEAKKLGMEAWLYDEDKWPSGFAGGIVPRKGPEYRNHMLIMENEIPTPAVEKTPLKAYSFRKATLTLSGLKEILAQDLQQYQPSPKENVFAFCQRIAPMGREWFNDTTYVDLLNPTVTDSFLASTYEVYAKRFRGEFGKTVPGIFTDEPCFLFYGEVSCPTVPWTPVFPEYFQKHNGYNVLDHLPEIFLDIGNYQKVRYDFWKTISRLFVESYSQRMYCWCEEHGLRYTGHYMAEDTLTHQIKWCGSIMPHYEFMHQPGMDHLGRNIDNVLTARQVSSVCHQLGRERALSELYGISGQDMSFEDRKWIADWHLIHGINYLNPHLSLYAMAGERKRDYPPTLSFQQPWWKDNVLIGDYTARLCYALSQGKRETSILVLHPLESAWMVYRPGGQNQASDELSQQFTRILDQLLGLHRDFDLGDESLLGKYGKIAGNQFMVGEAGYQVVIIPPCLTLRESTRKLLKDFVAAGGKVLAVKPFPTRINAQNVDLLPLFRQFIWVENYLQNLEEKLDQILPADIRIENQASGAIEEIWYHHRRSGDQDIYFLANTSRHLSFLTKVWIPITGKVKEWDALSGEQKTIQVQKNGDGMVFNLTFAPTTSHLLVVDRTQQLVEGGSPKAIEAVQRISIEGAWNIRRLQPNALPLDYCRYREGEDTWSDRVPIWQAREKLKETDNFVLEFSFEVKDTVPEEIYLAMETPKAYELSINDTSVTWADEGYYCDKSFRRMLITSWVNEGSNIVQLHYKSGTYREVEDIYLVGEFGVGTEDLTSFYLTSEPSTTSAENLTAANWPFFVGDVELIRTIALDSIPTGSKAILRFDSLNAIVAKVWVNENCAGRLIWHPYEVDVTPWIKSGSNEIKIQLTSSLRNLLGPNHHAGGELFAVGPRDFSDAAHWVDYYNLVPLGFRGLKLVWEN